MTGKAADKSTYHHGELRQAVIDAACLQLRAEGADSLSLRALARELGVSATAPYRHFASKNALFAAIAIYGFDLLGEQIAAARDAHDGDIQEAMVETGLAYVNWALANPEKYALCFDSSMLDFAAYPELQQAGNASFGEVLALIKRGVDEGVLLDLPVEQLGASIWSGIHGIASLLLVKGDRANEQTSPVYQALNYLRSETRTSVSLLVKSVLR